MKRKTNYARHDIKVAALEALLEAHGNRLHGTHLLEAARDPAHPWHENFEWDDDAAAELYRLTQANQILRQWKGRIIRIDKADRHVDVQVERVLQSPAGERGEGKASYLPVSKVMADPVLREEMIRTVLLELMAYRRRYAEIMALSGIWEAIDQAIELHEPRRTGEVEDRTPAGRQ